MVTVPAAFTSPPKRTEPRIGTWPFTTVVPATGILPAILMSPIPSPPYAGEDAGEYTGEDTGEYAGEGTGENTEEYEAGLTIGDMPDAKPSGPKRGSIPDKPAPIHEL
ncbi:unnamed protein product [Danaus chrysippus]|uniref:(African queen) hypothetical protein n=1 Tax=Danaus chrysippus TaxID=151541 RepID=A0A8J2QV30_9NEOP|nr:unnamed protein product [Danaus chrysippus]